MLYPLTFDPRFKERVWGGRKLEELYQKTLPPGVPIGESWEVSDRPGESSVIANGPLVGKDLHWLVKNHGPELLGTLRPHAGRFPLLIKLLDARDKLSLQVHPPVHKAAQLGGEPKTEMWYIADAAPGAELYVGLNRGVACAEFQRKVQDGTVAECFHRVNVRPGDAMFLPSGRVHAIGAGLVIFEIQQNSDTTYRVFDWNRVGLDGQPRALHIAESLASIDFADFEPSLVRSDFTRVGPLQVRPLVKDPLFTVRVCRMEAGATLNLPPNQMRILGILAGKLQARDHQTSLRLTPGQFCLLPASLKQANLLAETATSFLDTEAG